MFGRASPARFFRSHEEKPPSLQPATPIPFSSVAHVQSLRFGGARHFVILLRAATHGSYEKSIRLGETEYIF